ncbi:DUF1294 domain-containing protein [Alkalihalobacillus sp. BA299]|uniref:DUF1294 domain-containing protein n=1 Tax=Alkalihalobacillus sp. BA299 TaxID=2815938 RepID=UPI001ADB9A42|nr:DUF1294 domain-containing protein [Alkalihalobacillus sp. BA299]
MFYIASYFICISIVGLMLMGLDKRWARERKNRIPERTLFVIAFIGGSLGVYIGMMQFRHKTKKFKFRIGIPMVIVLQIAILIFLIK